MRLVADLQSRGLIQQVSDPQLDAKLDELASRRPIAAYAGFDPTADSLHVGHLLGILGLIYAQRNGIRPIAVVGGATGLIGDPSGKTAERQLQTKEAAARKSEGVRDVLGRFLDFDHPTAPARIVNNLDWFGSMSAIDFLRDVGKHFRIGSMMSKESVRARMESSEEGMSYTEFSYQILQGYDFHRLYQDHRCVLQMGGSDQWGNITAGIDLIRKLEGEGGHAFGLVWPLMTTSTGQKFGKTEGNAVWLSADRTSPFDFYQFWLRAEDSDVKNYLKLFTFLSLAEIDGLVAEHQKSPEKHLAQKRLALELTQMIHGKEATEQALSASSTLYGGPVEKLDAAAVEALAGQGVATTQIDRSRLEIGVSLIEACVETGLVKTRSDARRLIQQGGLYVNNQAVTDVGRALATADLIDNSAIVLRGGKKNYRVVRVG